MTYSTMMLACGRFQFPYVKILDKKKNWIRELVLNSKNSNSNNFVT
jgi:hypothetical protein